MLDILLKIFSCSFARKQPPVIANGSGWADVVYSLAWVNSRHFTTPPLVSPPNDDLFIYLIAFSMITMLKKTKEKRHKNERRRCGTPNRARRQVKCALNWETSAEIPYWWHITWSYRVGHFRQKHYPRVSMGLTFSRQTDWKGMAWNLTVSRPKR